MADESNVIQLPEIDTSKAKAAIARMEAIAKTREAFLEYLRKPECIGQPITLSAATFIVDNFN